MLIRTVRVEAYGEQIKTRGKGKSRGNLSREEEWMFFFISLKKIGDVGKIMITKKQTRRRRRDRVYSVFFMCF